MKEEMKMVFLKKNLLMMLFMVIGSFVFLGANSAYANHRVLYSANIQGDSGTGSYQIFAMNEDGTDVVQLTDDDGQNFSPTWIENGTKILWVSGVDCVGAFVGEAFHTMDPDGSNRQQISTCGTSSPAAGIYIQSVSAPALIPIHVAAVSTYGQFVIVFMLGGITAIWMTRRNSRVANE